MEVEERSGGEREDGLERGLLEEGQLGDLDSLRGQNIDRLNHSMNPLQSLKLLTGGNIQKTWMVTVTVVWARSCPI